MSEIFSCIEFCDFPRVNSDPISVRLGDQSGPELRIEGICTGRPPMQLLWGVEELLKGKNTVLVSYTKYPPGDGGSLHSIVKEGTRYFGICSEHISGTNTYPNQLSSNVEVSVGDLEESYPIDTLAFCEAVLQESEKWLESLAGTKDDNELRYKRFARLYNDSIAMVDFFRDNGSLEGFQLSRSKDELERFLYEQERLPRTEEFVREHDLVGEVILELLSSDVDDETVKNRLREAVKGANWITMDVLETLRAHPDDRAVAAYMPIHFENAPEFQHEAARMLSNLTHLEEARNLLEAGLHSVSDPYTKALIEKALRDAPNDFRIS